jgi:hypothetical protein
MSDSTSFFVGMTIRAITAAVIVVHAVAVCLDGPVRR